MRDFLVLKLQEDSDGTAELFVQFKRGEFSGLGSAWFNTRDVRAFGEKVAGTYPIPQGEEIAIAGGYWSSDDPPRVREAHAAIRIYAIGSSGRLGVQVKVAEPSYDCNRPESLSSASAEIETKYEQLRAFGKDIVAMTLGTLTSAALESSDA